MTRSDEISASTGISFNALMTVGTPPIAVIPKDSTHFQIDCDSLESGIERQVLLNLRAGFLEV
jgi:hypothetical protein